MIYLDNAATTKIDPEVLDAMMPWLTDKYGNAGAIYPFGQESKSKIEEARSVVAKFFGADSPSQIIFTSGGTESNNTAILDFRKDDVSYLLNPTEHHSILESTKYAYHGRSGNNLTYCKMDPDGRVNLDFISDYLASYHGETCLTTVMHMNNETGAINPVEEIGKLIKGRDEFFFHVDCVQSAGCIPIRVNEIGCTTASVSSHKIHGPKGVGALYIRDIDLRCLPLMFGGSNQEFGIRGGTENVAGIVGFAKACEICMRDGYDLTTVTDRKRSFWSILRNEFTRLGCLDKLKDNAASAASKSKILNFRIDGIDAETMVLMLGSRGVCVSAGSACTSKNSVPSHVLTSIGLSPDEARESIRVSFSRDTSYRDVVDAARIIAETACRLSGF